MGTISHLSLNSKTHTGRLAPAPAGAPQPPPPSLLQTYRHLVCVKARLLHHLEDLITGERLLHGLVLHQASQTVAQHEAAAARPLIEQIEADALASWRAGAGARGAAHLAA